LPAVENIAKLAGFQSIVKVFICLSPDIGGGVSRQAAADLID
jgi:hypothetical protein